MRRLVAATLSALIALGTPVWAVAQDAEPTDCLSESQRREALRAIRAGQLDALDELRSCEADLNETTGRLNELRSQYRAAQEHNDQLLAKLGQLQDRNAALEQRPTVWQAVLVGAGALLVGGAGGFLAGKLSP